MSKRKPGRPTGSGQGLELRLTVMVTEDLYDQVEHAARELEMTQSQWIRTALRQQLINQAPLAKRPS